MLLKFKVSGHFHMISGGFGYFFLCSTLFCWSQTHVVLSPNNCLTYYYAKHLPKLSNTHSRVRVLFVLLSKHIWSASWNRVHGNKRWPFAGSCGEGMGTRKSWCWRRRAVCCAAWDEVTPSPSFHFAIFSLCEVSPSWTRTPFSYFISLLPLTKAGIMVIVLLR